MATRLPNVGEHTERLRFSVVKEPACETTSSPCSLSLSVGLGLIEYITTYIGKRQQEARDYRTLPLQA